jgi:hypothetical protein
MGMRDIVEAFVKEQELAASFAEGEPMARIDAVSAENDYVAVVLWDDDNEIIRVSCVSTRVVPEERRAQVSEILARINFGLHVGAFEMDMDDGELRSRSSVDVEDVVLTPALVRNLFISAVGAMETFLPVIADVVAGTAPKAALTKLVGEH